MANLTGKQKAFIDHYLSCGFNAVEAARLAGYRGSYSALGVIGHRNLKKAKIADEIKRRLSERAMAADEVMARLADRARADIADFVVIDEESGTPKFDFAQARDQGKLHLIKKMYQDRNGRWRVELHDSTRALELVGKHHDLFRETLQMPGLEDAMRSLADRLDNALDRIYGRDD
ncbi:MAG: terminase small subunit [Anaerolineae bacterium]|nr:terminase small subunit [Anaerolineae bacterium]